MKLTINWFWALALSTTILGCSQADTKEQIQSGQETTTEDKANTKKEETKVILFFGNSLTAGYGLEPTQAFPALIQERLDSLGYNYKVVNAGVSGETSAGGKSRVDWLLKKPVDVFVLELGANDGLRGIDPESTYKNLKTIMDKVRSKNPDVQILLAGMQMPPSMGQKYATQFSEVFTKLAKEENVVLIPFLLEGVAGDPELNQKDGIHPTVEGQKILADNVWQVMEPLVKAEAAL
ncbi:arylesterase [Pontibacter fetidus]|uniref:arylesterase n=1 Tax=Pontibacter fetidus TaxID=2700082 RepID=UPI00293B8BE7|nr:arylesterase [Pontibacter fetidus]